MNYYFVIAVALCIQFLTTEAALSIGSSATSTASPGDRSLLNIPYLNFTIGGYKYSYPLSGHPPGPVHLRLPNGARIPLRLTRTASGVLQYGFDADGIEITVPYASLYKTLKRSPKLHPIKLPHPIVSKTYSNGATFFYGWSNGEYRSLPTTYTVASTTYTLTGQTGRVHIVGRRGKRYRIIPVRNGRNIEYIADLGGDHFVLSLGSKMSSSVLD